MSDASEAGINKTSLTFTVNNWNAQQTVIVTGLDDIDADGNVSYEIDTGPATSADTDYDTVDPGDVYLRNTDNEQAGVTFDPVSNFLKSLITTEGGGQITYTMVLNSAPTDDVVIDLASNDTTEGTVSPASLTFTAVNWNIE